MLAGFGAPMRTSGNADAESGRPTTRRTLLATMPLAAGSVAGCQDRLSPDSSNGSPSDAVQETDEYLAPAELSRDPLDHHPSRSRVIREFFPDTGPASIAVAFPTRTTETKQAYCFDAGACRFRYAWSGDFVDVPYTKDDTGEPLGDRYYTATQEYPLRLGPGGDEPATVGFDGFRLVEGLPEFRYRIAGSTVRQRIRPVESGLGVAQEFTIPDPGDPVTYVADRTPDVTIDASAGTWDEDRLAIDANTPTVFTITITEAPE